MSTARQQPRWEKPKLYPEASSVLPSLHVYNSLTRTKVPFIPIDPAGKKVTWYACGPTVYDDAHLGHARNYVSTDILRRILRDYFKFDVQFVMNMTDVDDKIITRGRQQYLYEQFLQSHPFVDDEARATIYNAYAAYIEKNLPLLRGVPEAENFTQEVNKVYAVVLNGGALEGDKPGDKEAKVKMHINTAASAAKALSAAKGTGDKAQALYDDSQDVLLPYLDFVKGSTVGGHNYDIFTKLTKKFEQRFLEDVRSLNILDPDVITRVTEYMPQIVKFVQRIVDHGFGYKTSDGSVYFDIEAFEAAGNPYARLEPWNRNDIDLLADGEGALTNKTTEKKSGTDFALWKASKPGEPSWPSPWGGGRPGWHIECSAMASDKFGKQMDVHSGGIDLAFPHHDNELAQSEAFWNDKCSHGQWVNYFFHMGHLSIQGSKMSKSLKNFTTIREVLDKGDWSPRSLRIMFLLSGWKEGVEITDDLAKASSSWEDRVNSFFLRVKDPSTHSKSSETDRSLTGALIAAQRSVYQHLCNSFNTVGAMYAISELITRYNTLDRNVVSRSDVQAIAAWITSMLNIFGLNGNAKAESKELGWSGIDVPEPTKPYLYRLSQMRDSLREAAMNKALSRDSLDAIISSDTSAVGPESKDAVAEPFQKLLSRFCNELLSFDTSAVNASKDILSICDRLRDVDLFEMGVYLEDREDQPALVRPVSKELLQAREEKAERSRQKQREKEEREKEAVSRAEKGKLNPRGMFQTSEFSAWDDDGVPTKDAQGNDLPKSRSKKLRKEWERQKRAYDAWLLLNKDKTAS